MGMLRSQLDLIPTSSVRWGSVLSCVLNDILAQHLVVKADGVLTSEVVIKRTAIWLNDEGLAGLSGVVEIVSTGVSSSLRKQELFVLPSRVLLIDQAARGAHMALVIITRSHVVHYCFESFNVFISGRNLSWATLRNKLR